MLLYEKRSEKNMTAKYLRLSSEDGDKVESNSISNQRELIESYAALHTDINLVKEYVDDGYTGTNFDRPGFESMIRDAQNGRINCIIVKDLSRLGRDYIGMGRYMERIFPLMGIRFIAINDNYDSAVQENSDDNTVVLFKNLLNDAYSRDISIKIRTQLDVKRRKGEFIGGFAPFGYKKDEKDRNSLVIDGYAAGVVYDIFQWKLDGMSTRAIAVRLNNNGIPSPYEYKKRCGMNYYSGFKAEGQAKWGAAQVLRILTNETYAGTMVQGKRQKVNYKIKQLKDVDKSEWIRVKDTHEPIIPKDVFDTVQKLLMRDTRTSKGENVVNIFSGLVVCGTCGGSMVRRSVKRADRQYVYLHCSTYHNGLGCTSHLINENRLERMVYRIIKRDIEIITSLENNINRIKAIPKEQRKIQYDSDKLNLADSEIRHYTTLKNRLNSDKNMGIITQEEYLEFYRTFETKIEQAQQKRDAITDKNEKILSMDTTQMPWIESFKRCSSITEINRRVLVQLVENITVIDKDNVTIKYHFDDEIRSVIKYCDSCLKDKKEAVGGGSYI